jgi:multidrug resistance efflux pump
MDVIDIRTRKIVVCAACVAAVLGVGLFAGSTPGGGVPTAPSPEGVSAAVVRAGALARTIRVTGSTTAAQAVVLRAPYLQGNRSRGGPGDFQLELSQLVTPGKRVRAGEVVAVFDNENMRNRLDNSEAEVAEAEGALRRLLANQAAAFEAHEQKIRVARADLDKARLDLETARVRSAIQAQQFALALEEAQATVEALIAQTAHIRASQAAEFRVAELDSEDATIDARQAKTNLERLTVRAPMDGLVVSEQIYRNGQFGQIRQGDQLRPGLPYVRVADLSRMIVEGSVNQVDAADLRTGQPVRVRFDAYPDLALSGRVVAVGAMARSDGMRANYVAKIPLTISLDRTDPRVIPDLSVSGDVQVAAVEHTPILPLSAIFYDDGRPHAYVETATGWERRELELELSDSFEAAVRSGVREGESVALEPPAAWRPGRSAPTTSVNPRVPAQPGG